MSIIKSNFIDAIFVFMESRKNESFQTSSMIPIDQKRNELFYFNGSRRNLSFIFVFLKCCLEVKIIFSQNHNPFDIPNNLPLFNLK